MSSQFQVGNGTPQGSVISPLLFTIMINGIFAGVQGDMGRFLFADDRALWKRGRCLENGVRKVQEAIDEVEQWGLTVKSADNSHVYCGVLGWILMKEQYSSPFQHVFLFIQRRCRSQTEVPLQTKWSLSPQPHWLIMHMPSLPIT